MENFTSVTQPRAKTVSDNKANTGQTKPNLDPCASLEDNLVWSFLYFPYRLCVYLAESNNIQAIYCSVK